MEMQHFLSMFLTPNLIIMKILKIHCSHSIQPQYNGIRKRVQRGESAKWCSLTPCRESAKLRVWGLV